MWLLSGVEERCDGVPLTFRTMASSFCTEPMAAGDGAMTPERKCSSTGLVSQKGVTVSEHLLHLIAASFRTDIGGDATMVKVAAESLCEDPACTEVTSRAVELMRYLLICMILFWVP